MALSYMDREPNPFPPQPSEGLSRVLEKELGNWDFDSFKLDRLSSERPLVVLGMAAMSKHLAALNLQLAKARGSWRTLKCVIDVKMRTTIQSMVPMSAMA